MKKVGFTLQEALITIGIIGVIAAITVPAIVKNMPNQIQAKYLKTYATLKDLTAQMLSDSDLYWFNSDGQGCDGLNCTEIPSANSVPNDLLNLIPNDPNSVQKYAAILAYYMHSSDFIPSNPDDGATTFNTSNGTHWSFIPTNNNNNNIFLIVDLNIGNAIVEIYNNDSDNMNEADTFAFIITKDGDIQPADIYGRALLNNPALANSKKEMAKILKDTENSITLTPENDNWWLTENLCLSYPSVCTTHGNNSLQHDEIGGGNNTLLFAPGQQKPN